MIKDQYTDELRELVECSVRVGERWDLVQAGGGNTSTKTRDDKMIVKASGVRLSSVSMDRGFGLIDHIKLNEDFQQMIQEDLSSREEREKRASEVVQQSNLDSSVRPSIETLLHALLPGSVFHTHPLATVAAFSAKGSEAILDRFTGLAFVPYATPGIDLAIQLYHARQKYQNLHGKEPEGYVLSNHGLIASGSTPEEAWQITDRICGDLEAFLGVNLGREKLVNRISLHLEKRTQERWITVYGSRLSPEEVLQKVPYFPDGVVFMGAGPLVSASESLEKSIDRYIEQNNIPPRVLILDGHLYVSGSTLEKARETEEVFRLHQMGSSLGLPVEALEKEEIHYLTHWEAEKYRQKL